MFYHNVKGQEKVTELKIKNITNAPAIVNFPCGRKLYHMDIYNRTEKSRPQKHINCLLNE